MRGFLIFLFVAKTTADRLGYDYQPLGQVTAFGNTAGGLSNNIGTELGQFGSNNILGITDAFASGLGGFDSGNSNINNFISNDNNLIISTSNNINGLNFNTANSDNGATTTANIATGNGYTNGQYDSTRPVDAEYYKEFYSYKPPVEADDDNFGDFNDASKLGAIRKNLRVIFIKTPENQALTNAALQLAKQASEDRTAIYVLTKQTDAAELAQRLQAIKSQHNANKPEVHFVKYRTQEDAVQAQQAIQAQYDALGGTTFSSNEGVAPVLNFATSASVGGVSAVGGVGVYGNAPAYLPPALL